MLLYYTGQSFEFHQTLSGSERSILRKSFWFLLFNTLVLPSLALTSIDGIFKAFLFQQPGSGGNTSSTNGSSGGNGTGGNGTGGGGGGSVIPEPHGGELFDIWGQMVKFTIY